MTPDTPTARPVAPFSEKSFYLSEFRGRTLAIAVGAADLSAPAPLEGVLKELEGNATRVVLLASEAQRTDRFAAGDAVPAAAPRLEGAVWRRLRQAPRSVVAVGADEPFAAACRRVVLRLGVAKLVWLDRAGSLARPNGQRLSFVDLEELRRLLAEPKRLGGRAELLREIELMLEAGLPAVNVCGLAGVAEDLFTYAGVGTLFTRERYVRVRALGLDDFDAAYDLICRGVEEGYLAPRSPEGVERILAGAFGAFVEDRHLAGIAALLPYEAARAAEVASIYTLTRFLGEGVGAHLVAHALARAREAACAYVFACTTSPPVVRFFERNGFRRASPEELPEEKWAATDPERRARLSCLRCDLD